MGNAELRCARTVGSAASHKEFDFRTLGMDAQPALRAGLGLATDVRVLLTALQFGGAVVAPYVELFEGYSSAGLAYLLLSIKLSNDGSNVAADRLQASMLEAFGQMITNDLSCGRQATMWARTPKQPH